jgi:chromosome segregation ATPase
VIDNDETFMENLDHDTQKLLEKERERYNVELDVVDLENKCRSDGYILAEKDNAIAVKDANIEYQRNHLDALKNELTRANEYYDQILEEVKKKIDEESQDIKDLERDLKNKKDERERLRKKTESLRTDHDNQSIDFSEDNERDLDEKIKLKLTQVEEAERQRKLAQGELNKIYEDWTTKLNQHINVAYSNSINSRDQEQLKEIKQLIKENDEVARSVNELLETFDFDIQGMTDNLQRLRDEDALILEELKRAEDAIQAKQHTLKYLNERILSLSQQLDAVQREADERRDHIEQLKIQVEDARAEIEAAGDDDMDTRDLEKQLAEKQAEVKELERKVKEKEALYDEWREKISIKQKVIEKRSKSRKKEYVHDPSDEVDEIIADYVNSHQNPVPIQKVGYRSYIYGTRNIRVEDDMKLGPIVVLGGDEVMKLADFLEYFSVEEHRKLDSW